MKLPILFFSFLCLPLAAALNISEKSAPSPSLIEIRTGSSSASLVSPSSARGQSFRIMTKAKVTGLLIKLAHVKKSNDLTLSIYPSRNGLPSGEPLFSDTGKLPTQLKRGAQIQINFPTPLNLAAGDYVFTLKTTHSEFKIRLNKDSNYPAGKFLAKRGTQWVVASSISDAVFSVLGKATNTNTSITSRVRTMPTTAVIINQGKATATTPLNAATPIGQTFKISGQAQLSGIVLHTKSVKKTADLEVHLYATSNDLPSGAPLYSDAVIMPRAVKSGALLRIDFPRPWSLSAGSYAVVLKTKKSELLVNTSDSDSYTGGSLIQTTGTQWARTQGNNVDLKMALVGTIDTPAPRPAASSGPNIIFVLADDWGWTDHNVAALAKGKQSDYYQTPNLKRLADEGVSFTSAYSQPNCAPTRAALMTGQYSPRTGNGVYNVVSLSRADGNETYTTAADQIDEDISGDDSAVTLAQAMYNSGYVTAHFGKYHVGSSDKRSSTHPLNQGFDFNYGGGQKGHPGNFYATNQEFHKNVGPELDPFAKDYTEAYIKENIAPHSKDSDASSLTGTKKWVTDAMGDAFISFMNAHQSGAMAAYPVYVQLNFYAVHTPIQGRPDLATKYSKLPKGTHHRNSGYAAMVENMDQTLGRVLNYLDDPNSDGNSDDSIAENTVVIFTSDNGGHMGPTTNTPLRGRKGMHYEGGIRVPLVIRQPGAGNIPAGKISDSLVHSVDFYPTILDFANATYPDKVAHPLDGESLHAHVRNPDQVAHDRSPIFFHFPGYLGSRAYPCSMMIKEIGRKRYKYIYAYDPHYDPGKDNPTDDATRGFDQYQLYNLTDDISEKVNLLDYIDVAKPNDRFDPQSPRERSDHLKHKELANTMAAELNKWLKGTPGDKTWNPIYPTYKSNFPGLNPALIGKPTGPAPATIPALDAIK